MTKHDNVINPIMNLALKIVSAQAISGNMGQFTLVNCPHQVKNLLDFVMDVHQFDINPNFSIYTLVFVFKFIRMF